MNIKYPDYDNCITNVPNSILKWFGIKSGKSLDLLDKHIDNDNENVVVFLLDGMGKNIIDNNLSEEGFFASNLVGCYSSVFPPTTVAATTSVMSGINPAEHGWLGWDCYYPQVDKNVTVFLNTETGTNKPAADYNVADKYCGYKDVVSKIIDAEGQAYYASPYAEPYPQSLEDICQRIKELCSKPGKKYIYAYWMDPDGVMHRNGCYSVYAKNNIRFLESRLLQLAKELENTTLCITADHGHIDSKNDLITEYPEIMDCLVRMPSIEPRALNFFVKPEKKEEFVKLFNEAWGEKFMLLTKEEVIEKQLFGPGTEHKEFRNMLGDFLGIAVSDLSIYSSEAEAAVFVGAHAGLTEDEVTIPLIVVDTDGV